MKLCKSCNEQGNNLAGQAYIVDVRNNLAGQAYTSWMCAICRKRSSHMNTNAQKICTSCSQEHSMCQRCGKLMGKMPCSLYVTKYGVSIIADFDPYTYGRNGESDFNESLKETCEGKRVQIQMNWVQLLDMLEEINSLEEMDQWKREEIVEEL